MKNPAFQIGVEIAEKGMERGVEIKARVKQSRRGRSHVQSCPKMKILATEINVSKVWESKPKLYNRTSTANVYSKDLHFGRALHTMDYSFHENNLSLSPESRKFGRHCKKDCACIS